MRVQQFEPTDPTIFKFQQFDFGTKLLNAPVSALAQQLTTRGSSAEKLQTQIDNKITLTIFLPSSGFVKIRVKQNTSVEGVIEAALKQYEQELKDDINKVPMSNNPKCYIL